MTPILQELKVFTGNANSQLARDICRHLGMELGQANVFKFSNDNIFVQILENVRSRDVFIVQSFAPAPVSDHIMELLVFIDAAKRASAARITAVIPYYGYGRTDKKDQSRVPITARLLADLITTAGAHRILTVDLHAGQIQGFFNIPVDELSSLKILAHYFKASATNDLVVVAADIGISKRARNMAEQLNAPLAIIEKRRLGNQDKTETLNIIGDTNRSRALLFDDEVDTGGSMISAAQLLKNQVGIQEVIACATHPVLSGNATERIDKSPLERLVVTDTVSLGGRSSQKITVLSVAYLFAQAIQRIHEGGSVGELFY